MNNNNIWGPPAWTFLHTVTYNYPENPSDDDKRNFYNFFMSLESLDSRENLVKWLIDLHNDVNRDNGKPVWSYSEVYNKYREMYNQTNIYNNIIIFTIILIVLILIFFLFNIYGSKKTSSK